MLGTKFIKFLTSILEDKSIPLQIFRHFISVIPHNSSEIFNWCIFYFGQKYPIKVPILTLLSALVKIFQIPHVIFQTTGQFFFKFWLTLQCHERKLICTLGQTFYTMHKRVQQKCKFFRLLGAPIKIHQILVIFETTNQFFFKFYITLQCHETQLLCTF